MREAAFIYILRFTFTVKKNYFIHFSDCRKAPRQQRGDGGGGRGRPAGRRVEPQRQQEHSQTKKTINGKISLKILNWHKRNFFESLSKREIKSHSYCVACHKKIVKSIYS